MKVISQITSTLSLALEFNKMLRCSPGLTVMSTQLSWPHLLARQAPTPLGPVFVKCMFLNQLAVSYSYEVNLWTVNVEIHPSLSFLITLTDLLTPFLSRMHLCQTLILLQIFLIMLDHSTRVLWPLPKLVMRLLLTMHWRLSFLEPSATRKFTSYSKIILLFLLLDKKLKLVRLSFIFQPSKF